MKVYKKNNIQEAFQYVALEIRAGRNKIVLNQIPKLNSQSRQYFRDAITHSFNYKTHGFDLDRIFVIKENGVWERVSKTSNPGDISLIDKIIEAMIYIGKEKRDQREFKKSGFSVEKSQSATDEELISEIKKRGYLVFKSL